MAGTNVGSIHYDLGLDTTKFDAAHTRVTTSTNNLGSTLTAFAKTAAIAFGAAAVTAAGFAIKSASEVENLRTNFDTLLGSADKGAKLFTDLQKMASATPFETTDLAQASQTLLAFGENSEELLPDLKMLGDVSLGNKAKFQQLSLVFGQIQSNGKLMGQDLLQLVNVGFNPLQKISDRTGESVASLRKKMENGQITFEMVRDEFKLATSEGGQFYKGTERGSKTLSGQFSTLKDNIGMAARALVGINDEGKVKDGSFYYRLTKGITKLNKVLEKVNWGKVIKDFGEKVSNAWTIIRPVFSAVFNNLKIITKQLMEFYKANQSWLLPIIKVIGVAIGIFLVIPLAVFTATVIASSYVIRFLVNVFISLVTAIKNAIQWVNNIRTAIFSFFSSAGSWLYNAGSNLINGLKNGIIAVWNTLNNWLGGIPNKIRNTVGNLWGILWGAGWHALNSLWDGMKNVWDRISGWLSSIKDRIKNLKGPLDKDKVMLLDEGKAVMQGFNNGLQIAYQDVKKTLSGINSNIGTNINVSETANNRTGQTPVSNTTITFSGPINLGDKSAVDEFFKRLGRNQELAQKGMATL